MRPPRARLRGRRRRGRRERGALGGGASGAGGGGPASILPLSASSPSTVVERVGPLDPCPSGPVSPSPRPFDGPLDSIFPE